MITNVICTGRIALEFLAQIFSRSPNASDAALKSANNDSKNAHGVPSTASRHISFEMHRRDLLVRCF